MTSEAKAIVDVNPCLTLADGRTVCFRPAAEGELPELIPGFFRSAIGPNSHWVADEERPVKK